MKDNRILHIDGDAIMHVVASAAEKRTIEVTHIPSSVVKEFKTRTEFWGRSKKKDSGWLANTNLTREGEGKEPFLIEDFTIEDKQVAEPVENCLHSVKLYIGSILEKLKCDNYKVYIGDGDTFRHEITMPVGRRYKQNRDSLLKALLLQEVEDYLMKHHNGIKIANIEVDDKLSMIAWKGYAKFLKTGNNKDDNNIIVSRDKDTAGTQGWWHNPDKMEIPVYIHGFGKLWLDSKGVVRGIGRKFKYFQLLFGDTSDGYEGRRVPVSETDLKLHKYGQKTVFKELAPLQTDKECWELIVSKYQEWVPEAMTYQAEGGGLETDDWKSWLQKHIDFVHMRRWGDDRIILDDVLNKMGVSV